MYIGGLKMDMVSCFKEQPENQYVARLNIRGVPFGGQVRDNKHVKLNPTLVNIA